MIDAKKSVKITRKYTAIIKIIITIGSVSLLSVTSCLHKEKVRSERQDSTLQDKDGNIYTSKIMLDGKHWIAQNLNMHITESYCYDDKEANCDQYGRLYTWEAATEACKMLGAGWRLPTNNGWREMAKQYGGIRGDSEDNGKTAYKTLLEEGNAAFNALLGGGRGADGRYLRLNAHGFYWSASEGMSIMRGFLTSPKVPNY